MPWKSMSVMDQRHEFVRLALAGGVSVTALCRRFGISRQTGHQLLRRHQAEGLAGLEPRSRRPHHSPRRVSAAMDGLPDAILADNGAPWGSAGWHEVRYTALGVWLLQLDIALLHGRPRHPQT